MNIPLEVAKQTIISALNDFDRDLGRRAAEILYNDERLKLVEADPPRTSMMACRPAGATIDDWKDLGLYTEPDVFRANFAPDFTEQENHGAYAIIDYEYHGTFESLKYLAHELGHAIADDIQQEQGRSFRDYSLDDLEKQAYFVQKIVTQSVAEKEGRLDSAPLKESFERAHQRQAAEGKFDAAAAVGGTRRSTMIMEALAGTHKQEQLSAAISPQNVPAPKRV